MSEEKEIDISLRCHPSNAGSTKHQSPNKFTHISDRLLSVLIRFVLAVTRSFLSLIGWRKNEKERSKEATCTATQTETLEQGTYPQFNRMAPSTKSNSSNSREEGVSTASTESARATGKQKSLSNFELRRLNLRCKILENPNEASVCSCWRCVKRMKSELFSSFEFAKSQGHIVVTSEGQSMFQRKKRHSLT